jgi:hypothetical protein
VRKEDGGHFVAGVDTAAGKVIGMDFVNTTMASALHYESADQFGALFHVVVVRQRFMITPAGLRAAPVQPPVRDADASFADGPPGLTMQESDLCPYKPCCDVTVNAVAYAPEGSPVSHVKVRLRVEAASPSSNGTFQSSPLIDKTLVITGERHILRRPVAARAMASLLRGVTLGLVRIPQWTVTSPSSFVSCPVRYDYAYGGENRVVAQAQTRARDAQVRLCGAENCLTPAQAALHPDAGVDGKLVPLAHSVCEANPLGCGYATAWYLRGGRITSLAAPRTEYPDRPFGAREFLAASRGETRIGPAGLGVVGRAWQPRRGLLGVIAEKDDWAEDEFPSLPPEFDHGYWNHAPPDQQCAHLRGDEIITLTNLSPAGAPQVLAVPLEGTVQQFQLPGLTYYLALGDALGRVAIKPCALDTVYIDPEESTVDLVWRSAISVEAEPERILLCVAGRGAAQDRMEELLQRQTTLLAETLVEA